MAVLLSLLGYLVGLPAGLAIAAVLQRLGTLLGPAALVLLACGLERTATTYNVTDRFQKAWLFPGTPVALIHSVNSVELPPAILKQVAGVGVTAVG